MTETDTALTIEVIRFPRDTGRWNLVHEYLKLRREVFVQQMNWGLHVHDDLEFEQYDTLAATYVIACVGDRVVGGARLIRTDNRNGIYSYMIKDASEGRLDGLPPDLCAGESASDDMTWELTRLVALPEVRCGEHILRACNEFLRSEGARQCLFLGPPAFLRMAKSMGFLPSPLGPICGNKDGRFLAFQCPVV